MNLLALLLLAFAMSMDAFAVAICRGFSIYEPKFKDVLKVGLIFGIIEAITPILGWLLGYFSLHYVERWDHWIIFFLMLGLGLNMIYGSFKKEDPKKYQHAKQSLLILVLSAISTSIDAFAVGVGLALVSVNILLAASMIGAMTCIMVMIGLLIGKKIGCLIGKKAEFVGGLILIFIGSFTLYQHFFA